MAAPMKNLFGQFSSLQNHFPKLLKHGFGCSAICNRKYSEIVAGSEPDDLYKKLFVEVKSFEPAVIDSYVKFVSTVAKELNINLVNVHTPPQPYQLERRTLLKSIHIYKKHRRQYEIRTHYKTFEFEKLTGSTANTMLEYIQRNLPEGVAMKVTKHKIESLPGHFKQEQKTISSTTNS